MAVKVYKRNTAGRRNMSVIKAEVVDNKRPEKSLVVRIPKKAGRGGGKISIRHRGGGARKKYRLVDFKMNKFDIPAKVLAVEKDPSRSAFIALVCFKDGEKRYILATKNMRKGTEVVFSPKAPLKEGNRTMLKRIPVGTNVCAVEMTPGKGAQIARSAGTSLLLQAIDNGMAHLKMPSGEIRMVREDCFATIGQISNFEHNTVTIGKAGRKRHMGRRPHVRGSAMNPVDHPHGGGEGRQPIGLKHPKTPWGKPTLGKKTRKKNKSSNKYILKRRKK